MPELCALQSSTRVMPKMKLFIRKLNICGMRKVNIYQYRNALLMGGHEIVDDASSADKVLVWTCAFREDFYNNSINVLKSYESMGKSVVAMGCLPSIDPELMKSEFGGEIIHFNNDREEFGKIFGVDIDSAEYPICEYPLRDSVNDFRLRNPGLKVGWDDQYIKLYVSEGCTKKCSYCTEIRAFGSYKSYPARLIVENARKMVERTGVRNLALFGDDIGAWGSDANSDLGQLILELTEIDPEIKVSLKQINPYYMKLHFELIESLVDSGKIFQILSPIQSASDRILLLMERGYSSDDIDRMFETLSAANVELETHVIAGFPTETREEWEETVDFVCRHRFRYVMGNIYMPGPGTKAAGMEGQIERAEREDRMQTGADKMERNGVAVGHSLNFRGREHITHRRLDLMEP